MAKQILPPASNAQRPFGLLPSVVLHEPSHLDCIDLIDVNSQHALSIIRAARELLRINTGCSIDELLEAAEYALVAARDAADTLVHLEAALVA